MPVIAEACILSPKNFWMILSEDVVREPVAEAGALGVAVWAEGVSKLLSPRLP